MDETRTPAATASEPLSGGRGHPFGSPAFDVGDVGCVLTEHLIEGVAQSYRPSGDDGTSGLDGRWQTEVGGTAGYRSRVYVVRPADPARFNGVVLVNWQNVTAGVDLGMPARRELELGFAWVGVTAQRVAVEGQTGIAGVLPDTEGLPAWDPQRYGSLHHPGDEFSYDIFSQAGRLVRTDRPTGPVDLLGGLEPRVVLAMGGSQSSMRLGSYLDMAHQRDRVFDGFCLHVHWGICPRPPDQPLQPSFAPAGGGLFAGSSQVRDDGGVPILVISTESEFAHNLPVRQPETDTFRHWEVAGAAHATAQSATEMEAVFARDGITNILDAPDRNAVDWSYVLYAGLQRLTEWVESGTPPGSLPRLAVADDGHPIARDADGNAVGGIRLPDLVAPTGVHLGTNAGNPLAALTGQTTPFTSEQLAAHYAGADNYLRRWDAAVDELARQGLVLADDADEACRAARSAAASLWPQEVAT